MAKSKDLRQLNIEEALRSREVVVEEKQQLKDMDLSQKKISLFDFVKEIRNVKDENLLDDEQNEKEFNPYIILRALSMNSNDLFICNMINEYQSFLPKKLVYKLLITLIEKDHGFYKYISNKNVKYSEYCPFVSKYYNIPMYQAAEYIQLMGNDWAKQIFEMYNSEGIQK